MKRLVFAFCIVSFMLVLSVTSYAADISNKFNVDVKTKYIEKDVVVGDEDNKSGDLVAEMDDGVVITAKGTFVEETQLMVKNIQKNKNSEWDWIQGITSTLGKNKYVYYIFFVDNEGNTIEDVKGCEISVLLESVSKNMEVYFISSEGQKKRLEFRRYGRLIKFNMIKNGFYTLVYKEKKEINVNEENISEDDKDNKDNKDNNADKVEQNDSTDDKNINNENDGTSKDDNDNSNKDDKDNIDNKDEGISKEDYIYKESQKGNTIKKNQDIKENIVWIFIVIIIITIVIVGIIFIILLREKQKEDEDL